MRNNNHTTPILKKLFPKTYATNMGIQKALEDVVSGVKKDAQKPTYYVDLSSIIKNK